MSLVFGFMSLVFGSSGAAGLFTFIFRVQHFLFVIPYGKGRLASTFCSLPGWGSEAGV